MNIISLCSLCGMSSESHPHSGCALFTTTASAPWPQVGTDWTARQRLDVLERDYIHKETLAAILKPLRDKIDEVARRDTWLGEIETARDGLAKDLCVMEVKLKEAEKARDAARKEMHSACISRVQAIYDRIIRGPIVVNSDTRYIAEALAELAMLKP